MVGQAHVVQALGNALAQQRLHHAYLFTGTRGVGKTTISRILAKSINCTGADGTGGITAEPCGQCPACQDIDAGRFVDYTELDAASNRSVEEVQQLLEQAIYKPVQGRFKVFMIDEVHMLTGHAFNAMLKTLEEPPDYLKFVLATTDPQKVPATVLSRCLQFNLRPMAPETVQEHLQHVLAQEGIEADAAALHLLSRAARGSMRDALSLTDQAIAFGGGQVQAAQVRQMLGSVDSSTTFALIEALAAGDGRRTVELCDALRSAGQSAANTLEAMAAVLQRMAVEHAAPGMGSADEPDAAEVRRLAALMPADETQLLYSICIHGRAELGLAPDEYAGLVMTLLRLLPFKAPPRPPAPVTAAPPPAPPPAPVAPTAAPQTPPLPAPPAPPAPPANAAPTADGGDAYEAPPLDAYTEEYASAAPAAEPAPPPAPPAPQTLPPVLMTPASEAAIAINTQEAQDNADFWCQLAERLVAADAVSGFARALALQAQLVQRSEGHWTLHCAVSTLTGNAAACEKLQAALAAAGHTVRLEVRAAPAPDTPTARRKTHDAKLLGDARALLLADPFVQQISGEFGARLIEETLKAEEIAPSNPNTPKTQ